MRLRQPDRRSCGAASLVMARRLVDPRYAALVSEQQAFAHETATLHRRLTSPTNAAGARQVPWLRALGTAPWAVARDLEVVTGVPYAVHQVRVGGGAWELLDGTTLRRPAAVYVGDRWLPRHVVLVTAVDHGHARTYEPSSGLVVEVPARRWGDGHLGLAGWDRTWFVVRARLRSGP